jgi:hypothetical protein
VDETDANLGHGNNALADTAGQILVQSENNNSDGVDHYIFKVPVSIFDPICKKHQS